VNNPDLPYPNGALPKTDDNPNFGPIADDFMFFSDEDGNDMIGFGELEDFGQAYFKYVGDESLAYYSVKANGGFTLYTYMTGLNSLAYVSTQAHNISHVLDRAAACHSRIGHLVDGFSGSRRRLAV